MRTSIRRNATAIALVAGLALTGVACEDDAEQELQDVGDEIGDEVDPDGESE